MVAFNHKRKAACTLLDKGVGYFFSVIYIE